jgi:predicted MFS family arabinose efflux permease
MTQAHVYPNAVDAAEQPPAQSEQRALLLALGTAAFMVGLDARVVAPLLPTIATHFQTSVAEAGWLVSAYSLPYGFCQLAYGPLADRFGKVRVATHAMVFFSLGTALCGAFPSFGMIVLLRALTGAAAAALIPLTIAYIGDTVPYGQRQAALAMLMATVGAAQAFSTSAGGMIAAVLDWRSVFPLLGGLAAVATAVLFAYRRRELRPSSQGIRPGYREALRAPQMLTFLVLVASEGFLYVGGFSFLSGLLEQRFQLGSFAIGLLLGLAGVSQLLAARCLPWLLARTSERTLLALGGSAMGVAYLLSAVAPTAGLVGLASLLVGAGFALCHSTLQTRATEAFPRGRGTALALFAFSLFVGSSLGTICVGYASDAFGYARTFAAEGVLLLLFTWVVVRLLGRRALHADAQ